MSKLLISWIAHRNDFNKKENSGFESVDMNGPHVQFYKHFYKERGYDRHILLYSRPADEMLAVHLASVLSVGLNEDTVQTQLLHLNDIISLDEIKPKIESLLLGLRENEIDIFFSPGTSIMQLSWFICHQTLGLNTHLIQTRAGRFTESGIPELEELTFERTQIPQTAVLKQFKVERPKSDSAFMLTPGIVPVYKRAYQVAQTDNVTVLIRGESGTGKEHLAKYVHQESARVNKPFFPVNCSAFTESLLESRLFGHKKGTFTGADSDAKGIFEKANGGTVFLDEIGHISPMMQQALLRVLQEHEIQPVGGEPHKIDVRIIAATNAPLEQMCKEGTFRWDLYYRLAVAELELPTFSERGAGDLKIMLDHFINVKKQEFNKPKALKFSKEAMAAILAYTYPGNIRELENMIESLYVFCEDDVQLSDLPKRLREPDQEHSLLLEDMERTHILKVYKLKEENLTHTTTTLGIAKNTLKNKLRKYGVLKEEELQEV